MAASPCLNAFILPGVRLTPPLPGMPATTTLIGMIFVYSIRDMFVCSLAKTFGHLSDRAKKTEIDRVLTLEHYTCNKVFVSREEIIASFAHAHLTDTIGTKLSNVCRR